jgi:hypothetical protein
MKMGDFLFGNILEISGEIWWCVWKLLNLLGLIFFQWLDSPLGA